MSALAKRNYKNVSWHEVSVKNPAAYDRFKNHVIKLLLHNEKLRIVFETALDGVRPTAENVLTLFIARVKTQLEMDGSTSQRYRALFVSSLEHAHGSKRRVRVEPAPPLVALTQYSPR